MTIIMKGMGIAVVVIFFLTAFITGIWYDDYTLGNYEFTKWIFTITGSITCLMSLGTFSKQEFLNHTLMFIPIIFWGIGFTALGIYQFVL
jgi:uncharacterized membrane protein YqjE